MARLPDLFRDRGKWGSILLDFLRVSHNEDGSLKSDAVGAAAGDVIDDAIANNQTVIDTAAAVAELEVFRDRVESQPLDIREFAPFDMTGTQDATLGLQSILSDPDAARGLVVPPGRLLVEGDLTVPNDLQTKFRFVGSGTNITFIKYEGNGSFLQLDDPDTASGTSRRQFWDIGNFYLSGPGSGAAGTVGLDLYNALQGKLWPVVISGFETGIRVRPAVVGNGAYYNAMFHPIIFGCVTGMIFEAGSNSNQVFGGSIKQCDLLLWIKEQVNNVALFGTDLEGATGESAVVIDGAGNTLNGVRFENPGADYDIHFNRAASTGGHRNHIIGDYFSSLNIMGRIKDDSTNKNNTIQGPGLLWLGDSEAFQNPTVIRATRSAAGLTEDQAMLDLIDTGSSSGSPTGIKYTARRTGSKLLNLLRSDGTTAYPVMTVEVPDLNGWRMLVGSGTAAPDIEIRRYAGNRWGTDDYFKVGAASLITPTVGYRGYMSRVEGAAGAADHPIICAKDEADTYVWRADAMPMVATKTATFTAAATDMIYLVDATEGAVTVNLPSAAATGVKGRQYTIKKVDGSENAVTIDPNGAQTVDGAATKVISTQYEAVTVVSDGANWFVVG